MAPIPSIFLAIPGNYSPLTVPGHYTQLLYGAPLSVALESLQAAPVPPELVVLDAFTLLESGLGTLVSLKITIAQSGATLLLVSDLSESLTARVAQATGAHAAVFGKLEAEPFARLAELLLSERVGKRAAAATLHKEAVPRPLRRSNYLPVPA